MPAAFGLVPRGWALCDGSLLSIQSNQALFALLGTTFGGDGRSTFGLPDLRGRAVLGSDLASVPWGQVAGTETVTVTVDQLPSHTHVVSASTTAGTGRGSAPNGNLFGINTASPVAIFAT
ncbi:phage tail protein, partial [Rhodoplanes roseus]|uniref:phage tail protein n=1 Tax=Rhodoplanes roseus TaxID=29409 RepID=UPI001FE11D0E